MCKIKKSIDDDGDLIYDTPEGDWHNPHGPAVKWHIGGVSFFVNNKSHNIVGPAKISYNLKLYYSISGHSICDGWREPNR